MSQFIIRKAAVLGAGMMGAQIAAHLANAQIPVLLFDLPAADLANAQLADTRKAANRNIEKAIAELSKRTPPPLAKPELSAYINAANYETDLAQLSDCDLVIEAITETMALKEALYAKIVPFLSPSAVLASNTSGLSIKRLAATLPEALQARFCGVHFFNPPRYMHLVELIGHDANPPPLLDQLESWLVSHLGKGVVRAHDTPNFIANRVGIFSILATIHHTERLGLSFDLVDALTGKLIGRPTSATYRTADLVGLDTLAHVIQTLHHSLPSKGEQADPWHRFYKLPNWFSALISRGALGQ
ncbi:MAG: 3-hydroxyacyl-CoA dehydrogenase family protein, partial [Pseudomonadota bacterium]